MNLSPHNLSLSHIKGIYEESYSCIKKISTNYTLLLHPLNLKELKKGVKNELDSMSKTYVPEFHGILMAYEGVKVTSPTGWLFDTNPFVHVNLFAHFYVFAPTIGSILRGKVVKKSPNHVGCLVHGIFNVSSSIPRSVQRNEWYGTEAKEGDTLDLEVTFLDLTSLVPYLTADIVPGSISSIDSAFTNVKGSRIVFNDDDSGISSVGKQFEEESLKERTSSNKELNEWDVEEPKSPKKKKKLNESSEDLMFNDIESADSHSKLSKKKHKSKSKDHSIDEPSEENFSFNEGESKIKKENESENCHSKLFKKKSKSKSKDLETNLDPCESFMSDLNEFEVTQAKLSKKKKHKSKSKDLDHSIDEPSGENISYSEGESKIKTVIDKIKVENDSGTSVDELSPKKKKKDEKNKLDSLVMQEEMPSEDDFSEGSKKKRKLNLSAETYKTLNPKKKKKIKL